MFHAGCENRLYMSSQIQVLHRLVVERLYEIFYQRNPERKYKKGYLLFRKTERVCTLRSNVTERPVLVWISCLGEAFLKIV